MKRDDALWKALIEDLAEDFLKFFFPNVEEILDLNRKIIFLDKELEQLFPVDEDDFNPKYVDKLLKVYTKKEKKSGFWFTLKCKAAPTRNLKGECLRIIIVF